jgi:hypothetical protein
MMRELWRETERTGENMRTSSGAEQGRRKLYFSPQKLEWRWTEDVMREKEISTWVIRSKQDRHMSATGCQRWQLEPQQRTKKKPKNRKPKNAPDLKSTHNHRIKMGMKSTNESQNFCSIKTK